MLNDVKSYAGFIDFRVFFFENNHSDIQIMKNGSHIIPVLMRYFAKTLLEMRTGEHNLVSSPAS